MGRSRQIDRAHGLDHLLEVGLAQIPTSSPIAHLVADIRQWRREYPDWRDARQAIEARYGYDKYPGHCHVVPNHALMILALLYAPHDFSGAQTIVCTSGWDTDCNAGNVGCLIGAMLGLEGIEAEHDWRGPIADRMLISSADGGDAINDAVRVSARLVDSGRKLAGLPPEVAPKEGAQFHFSHPGSVQGFMATGDGAAHIVVGNVPLRGARALQVRYAGLFDEPTAVLTPTFAPPEVTRMRTYELMATPLVYSGETVRARGHRRSQQRGSCSCRPAGAGLWRERLPLPDRRGAGCASAWRGDRLDVAFARHGRAAHPVAWACPSLEQRRGRWGGHA